MNLVPVKLDRRSLVGNFQPALARVQKRLQTRSVLALTLTAGRTDVRLVRGVADGEMFTRVVEPVAVGADEVLRNPEKAGAVLGGALDAAGLREKRCAVGIPPAWVLTASVDLPAVSPEDLRGYLEIRAEREFSIPLSELRLAYSAYTLADGTSRATLAALPAKRLEAVENLLAAAGGRRAVSITLALDGCFADGEPTLLHLLADGGQVDVVVTAGVVAAGQGIAALRTLPGLSGRNGAASADAAGSPALAAPAADALAVPDGANGSEFNPAAFCREVRITLGRLPTVVQEQVRAARFGGADAAAADRLFEQTRVGLRRMGIESTEEYELDNGSAPAFSAVRHLRRETVPFEFVVAVPNRWEILFTRLNTPRGRKVAALVAALILLPLLLFFIRGQQESRLQAEWASMNANVNELDALQKKISRFRPWFDRTPTRVQLLESLFAAFPEGGEVWAKSIQINGGKVSCTGFARNQKALLDMLGRLRARNDVKDLHNQAFRGDNPIQFSFTYRWEQQH